MNGYYKLDYFRFHSRKKKTKSIFIVVVAQHEVRSFLFRNLEMWYFIQQPPELQKI